MITWFKIIDDYLFLYVSDTEKQERQHKGQVLRVWKKNERVDQSEVAAITKKYAKHFDKLFKGSQKEEGGEKIAGDSAPTSRG